MFERRLRILLGVLAALALSLLVRAFVVQVMEGDQWRQKASETMRRSQLLETVRGRILDFKGREIAVDEPCIEAAVDYRAIEREPKWMQSQAIDRLLARDRQAWRQADRAGRQVMVDAELKAFNRDLDAMWGELAAVSGQSRQEIDQIQTAIRQRVGMRARAVWYRRYELAMEKRQSQEQKPWYRQFLLGTDNEPELDSFVQTLAEQTQAHVILRGITTDAYNRLKKQQERFPALVLRPSTRRAYPFKTVACQVIGHLSRVNREDLENDPSFEDELKKYYPNDLIGRGGLEGLCEQRLRGDRGRLERFLGRDEVVESTAANPGQDVKVTLDMELQSRIQQVFQRVQLPPERDGSVVTRRNLHGAAVVIDVPTGQVRALVSSPGYDANELETGYSKWVGDEIDFPLLNRAVAANYPPGSTVKPMVGLAGLGEKVVGLGEGIECTGYLIIDGKKLEDVGRCWTARQYGAEFAMHHPIPIPHPTGFLTIADALERSCNVYFETVADRVGMGRLVAWMDKFGLGRPTGLGLADEVSGKLPDVATIDRGMLRSTTWFAGIGQGQITATPIQLANFAATIARNGVWITPGILPDVPRQPIDLGLDRSALAAVKLGMMRVVNSDAGTGQFVRRNDVTVCGKTGSAQAGKFSVIQRDEKGDAIMENGRPVRKYYEPGVFPWYQGVGPHGTDLAHAWFIGFAPAENPTIAFCVLVEYGGSGGKVAGAVARELLDACVEQGYLPVRH